MEEVLRSIDIKMNIIISLLLGLQNTNNEEIPEVKIIKKFHDLKLSNEQIAEILNKTPTQISKQLYKAKKRKI